MLPFQGANGGCINYPTRCVGLKYVWLSAKNSQCRKKYRYNIQKNGIKKISNAVFLINH
jgi:hypothetical protein